MLPTDNGRGSEPVRVVERIDAIPADRHAVGRVVGQARQRLTRRTPRPAQRGRRRTGPPARCERAGASEDAARLRGSGGSGGHGSALPASQAACRSAVYSGSGRRAASRLRERAPVRGRDVDWRDAQRLDGVDAFQHGAHLVLALGVQQQARARLHAGDALRRVQRRASLHHHELPADRAVVVGLPADAAEHRARQEHRAAPPAVELERARRFAEAQVELEARFDVGQRHARQRRAGRLAGRCDAMGAAVAAPAAGEADAVMVCSPCGVLETRAPAGRAAGRPRSRLA